MNDSPVLARKLEARLGAKVVDCTEALGETTIEVLPENWLAVARFLRDEAASRSAHADSELRLNLPQKSISQATPSPTCGTKLLSAAPGGRSDPP